MNPDARISTALADHHKTKKLHKRLGGAGCWALVCLFLYTARNKPSGDLSGMTDEDIELAANWVGDDGALVEALTQVRFLDGGPNERFVHDWAEHNPWAASADARSAAASAAAKSRWNKETDAEVCAPHAEGMRPASIRNAPSPSPSPSPNQKDQKNLARGARLDPEWMPPADLMAEAVTELGEKSATRELAKFRDYWAAVAGAKGRKADWNATFRNWCRNAADWGKARAGPTGQPSKGLSTIQRFEDIKNGLADTRNSDRVSKTDLPQLGSGTSGRLD